MASKQTRIISLQTSLPAGDFTMRKGRFGLIPAPISLLFRVVLTAVQAAMVISTRMRGITNRLSLVPMFGVPAVPSSLWLFWLEKHDHAL